MNTIETATEQNRWRKCNPVQHSILLEKAFMLTPFALSLHEKIEMKISCKGMKNIVTIALATCLNTYKGQVTVKKFLEKEYDT
jgi:hypothetical protein